MKVLMAKPDFIANGHLFVLRQLTLIILLLCSFIQTSFAQTAESPADVITVSDSAAQNFDQLLAQIPQGSLAERAETLKKLAALNDLRSIDIITALLQGKLVSTLR